MTSQNKKYGPPNRKWNEGELSQLEKEILSQPSADDTKRQAIPLDGYCQKQTTEEQLNYVNQRWEEFYYEKKGFLSRYARGDDDLISIGLLSVRKTLSQHPDCPESWLVHRAKLDINNARAPPNRLYLSLDKDQEHDDYWVNDALLYEAMTPHQRDPETVYMDRVKFNNLYNSLSEMEQKLLMILREEQIMETRHRWYGGTYTHTHSSRPRPKKQFLEEVSKRERDWYLSFANVRYQFYMHFGTAAEIKREKEWYASFDPSKGGLHANRDGRYEQNKK